MNQISSSSIITLPDVNGNLHVTFADSVIFRRSTSAGTPPVVLPSIIYESDYISLNYFLALCDWLQSLMWHFEPLVHKFPLSIVSSWRPSNTKGCALYLGIIQPREYDLRYKLYYHLQHPSFCSQIFRIFCFPLIFQGLCSTVGTDCLW